MLIMFEVHVIMIMLQRWSIAIVMHMIMLQVQVIMMITKLVERNKVQAHQYWPSDGSDNLDIDDPTEHIIDLGDDCKVQFKSSSFQGTYYLW